MPEGRGRSLVKGTGSQREGGQHPQFLVQDAHVRMVGIMAGAVVDVVPDPGPKGLVEVLLQLEGVDVLLSSQTHS